LSFRNAPTAITALKRRVRDFQTPEGVACANALAKFGAKANWAAPELVEALRDSRIEIRVAATNALLKVMPEGLQSKQLGNVPVKNTNPGISVTDSSSTRQFDRRACLHLISSGRRVSAK
jgi:hypothetical protein